MGTSWQMGNDSDCNCNQSEPGSKPCKQAEGECQKHLNQFFVLRNLEIPFKMHQQKVLVTSDYRNFRTVKIVEEIEHVEEVEEVE